MLDTTYEDLRVAYFAATERYEDAVDALVLHVQKGSHGDFLLVLAAVRSFSAQVDEARIRMIERRLSEEDESSPSLSRSKG